MSTQEERLNLVREILERPTETVKLETEQGVIEVVLRYPANKERIEAMLEASKLPEYKELSELEKTSIQMEFLAKRIIQSIRINGEEKQIDWENGNAVILEQLVTLASSWYQAKRAYWAKQIQPYLLPFLQQTRELLQLSSTTF